MSAIETIRTKLQSYPKLQYEHTHNSITVKPETHDGFSVSLHQNGASLVVSFAGWHEHFDSEPEALKCFLFGLSSQCRIRVTRRGNTDYRWTLQLLTDGTWHDDSQVGIFTFPFWRRRSEHFLQNHIAATHHQWLE